MDNNINIYERLHSGEFDTPANEYGKTCWHGYGSDRLIPEGSSVLDVGAGRTPWLSIIKKEKKLSRAACTDISLSAVKYQIFELKIEAYLNDMVKLPFEDGEFDIVTSFGVIEHLEESDIEAAMNELIRVCKYTVILMIGTGGSVWGGTELHLTQKTEDEWLEYVGGFGNVVREGNFYILTRQE